MDYTKYKNPLPYPSKPAKPINPGSKGTPAEFRQYADDLEKYDGNMKTYHELVEQSRKEKNKIMETFKQDALKDAGLENHPNRDKIFNFALNHEGSNELESIYDFLEEMVNFGWFV